MQKCIRSSLFISDNDDALIILSKNDRSSHRRYSVEKGVVRNVAKLTKKHLCQGHFFNKVVGLRLRPATLLKRNSGTGVFL